MLDLTMGLHRSCDRVTRRELLRVGSLAALGISLPGFLEQRARAGRSGGKDVSCILIWLQGGISHIDSFDPKPAAPPEIRGEFGVIATNVPGISLCDPLPKLRSTRTNTRSFARGTPRTVRTASPTLYMLTGHPFNPALTYPAYGAVVARELGDRKSMPPYIQLGNAIDKKFGGGCGRLPGRSVQPLHPAGRCLEPRFHGARCGLAGRRRPRPLPVSHEGAPRR